MLGLTNLYTNEDYKDTLPSLFYFDKHTFMKNSLIFQIIKKILLQLIYAEFNKILHKWILQREE